MLDGYGGLHAFAVGGNPMPPPAGSYPYWRPWDIARGVAVVPTGSLSLTSKGGLVLDGWGGIHPFTINGVGSGLTATGSQYWQGWDIARGITVSHDGTGGYVGDGWGVLHPFSLTQAPLCPCC